MPINKKSKARETEHALQSELEFKAEARRNKLVGLWAADKMGIDGDDAQAAYAKEVIIADLDEPGVNDVVRKVMADFEKNNTAVTEDELRKELDAKLITARSQILEENNN